MSQTGRERREPPFLSETSDISGLVPKGLRVSAALSWRFLVVITALGAILYLVGYLATVVVPVSIALLLSALLAPGVSRLVKWRLPRGLATAAMLILAIVVLGGLLTFVITQFSSGLPQLQVQLTNSLNQIRDWVISTFHVRQEQIQNFLNQAIGFLNKSWITNTALTTASTVGEILTGFALTLFVTIFFLAGGESIWTFLVRGAPRQVRSRVNVAGRRGFASLVSYIRATTAVAVVDAVGIGIGLWAVGVPLVIPLATLVFLGAFIPIIGAVLTGGVAVLIALVTNGVIGAVIVLAIVIVVMQLESHILQPLLLGRAVKLHPLAVVLAIAIGLVAAGIAGALLSVPLLAVLNAGTRSLLHEADVDPADVDALHGRVPDPPKETGEEPSGKDAKDSKEAPEQAGEQATEKPGEKAPEEKK